MAYSRGILLFRLFLLALLALEWATDPHHGRSPFSAEYSSQLVEDVTVGIRPSPWNRLEPTSTDCLAVMTIPEWSFPPGPHARLEQGSRLFSFPLVLIYRFMSILR